MNEQIVRATARATAIHGHAQHQQNVITEQIAKDTAAVERVLRLPRHTAARRVDKARKADLLPETTRGKKKG
jgi:hypothetical protein